MKDNFVKNELDRLTNTKSYPVNIKETKWAWYLFPDKDSSISIYYDEKLKDIIVEIRETMEFEGNAKSLRREVRVHYEDGADLARLVNDCCKKIKREIIKEAERMLEFSKLFPNSIF